MPRASQSARLSRYCVGRRTIQILLRRRRVDRGSESARKSRRAGQLVAVAPLLAHLRSPIDCVSFSRAAAAAFRLSAAKSLRQSNRPTSIQATRRIHTPPQPPPPPPLPMIDLETRVGWIRARVRPSARVAPPPSGVAGPFAWRRLYMFTREQSRSLSFRRRLIFDIFRFYRLSIC